MLQNTALYTTHIQTDIGEMIACATDEGLYLLEFSDNSMWESEIKLLFKNKNFELQSQENDLLKKLRNELNEYFEGIRKDFSIPIVFTGTAFRIESWKMLQNIPYGETRTYQQQAGTMNAIKAIRAVAAANGNNKIAILIPCHRVIGSNGKLIGYRGGLERKRMLLQLEANQSTKGGILVFN